MTTISSFSIVNKFIVKSYGIPGFGVSKLHSPVLCGAVTIL